MYFFYVLMLSVQQPVLHIWFTVNDAYGINQVRGSLNKYANHTLPDQVRRNRSVRVTLFPNMIQR